MSFGSLGYLDLKSALGKRRRDGKSAPLQPLTNLQRIHIGKLVEKHGDDYQVRKKFSLEEVCSLLDLSFPFLISLFLLQSMFMDTKLNKLQHSAGALEKLCKRYHMYKDKNPLIVGC